MKSDGTMQNPNFLCFKELFHGTRKSLNKIFENLKDHRKIGKLCITLRLYGLYIIFQVSCYRIEQPLPPLYLIVV